MQDKTIAALRSQLVSVLVSVLVIVAILVAVLVLQDKFSQPDAPDLRASPQLMVLPSKGPEALSQAICDNYSVSCAQARETLRVVMEEAETHSVAPALAVGLALHESGFRANAKSSTGDHGLLQINYKWHKHSVRRLSDLYDPRTNVRIGLTYLKSLLDRKGNVRVALRHYNGANGTTPYPDEVLKKANWVSQFI